MYVTQQDKPPPTRDTTDDFVETGRTVVPRDRETPMTARALLVGASGSNLTGVGTDLDSMSVLLSKRGFVIDRIEDAAATRSAILAAYRRLIATTTPGDASLFYYAGHGGRVLQSQSNGTTSVSGTPAAF